MHTHCAVCEDEVGGFSVTICTDLQKDFEIIQNQDATVTVKAIFKRYLESIHVLLILSYYTLIFYAMVCM